MDEKHLAITVILALLAFILGRLTGHRSGTMLSDIREPKPDWALFIQHLRRGE